LCRSLHSYQFVRRMDQDGSLNISYDEWRDYLLLAPATDIHALIHFWRHSTVSTLYYANNQLIIQGVTEMVAIRLRR
jgi:hypothetical protein